MHKITCFYVSMLTCVFQSASVSVYVCLCEKQTIVAYLWAILVFQQSQPCLQWRASVIWLPSSEPQLGLLKSSAHLTEVRMGLSGYEGAESPLWNLVSPSLATGMLQHKETLYAPKPGSISTCITGLLAAAAMGEIYFHNFWELCSVMPCRGLLNVRGSMTKTLECLWIRVRTLWPKDRLEKLWFKITGIVKQNKAKKTKTNVKKSSWALPSNESSY